MADNMFQLNHEGAETLRGFAQSMEDCLEQIESIIKNYTSELEDNIDGTGVLRRDYEEVENQIVDTLAAIKNAITPLPEAMVNKAKDIDDYVDRRRDFFQGSQG